MTETSRTKEKVAPGPPTIPEPIAGDNGSATILDATSIAPGTYFTRLDTSLKHSVTTSGVAAGLADALGPASMIAQLGTFRPARRMLRAELWQQQTNWTTK